VNQYDFGKTEDFKPMDTMEAHPNNYILKCKLSLNKRYLATCSSDRSCKIWQYNLGEEKFEAYQTLGGHHHWVWDCDFTVDCVYCLTVSTDTRIRIWKIDEAKVKKVINGHQKGITSLAFKDMM
jgi:target of rapamycin complex subunit LST8